MGLYTGYSDIRGFRALGAAAPKPPRVFMNKRRGGATGGASRRNGSPLPYVLCVLLFIATGAAAQVSLPEGCTAYITVQQKQCLVTHHYTCADDPDGVQWRVDFDADGGVFVAQIDTEAQWLYSVDLRGGGEDSLEDGPVDPQSMTELLDTGLDTWDFRTRARDGDITRYRGFDRLTGETAVIDDIPLMRTYAEIEAIGADGETLWSAKGRQFVSPKWRMFFHGSDTYTNAEGVSADSNHSPVEFIFPGEAGFLSPTPKYECSVEIASLPPLK